MKSVASFNVRSAINASESPDSRIAGGPDALAQSRLRREQLGGVIGTSPQMELDRHSRCREALRNQDVLIPKQVEVAHIDVGGWQPR